MTRPLLVFAMVVFALPAGRARAQSGEPRQVRELDASDPALQPVLFAAVDHIFDRQKGPLIGFDGVYINRRLEPSLTANVRTRLDGRALARIEQPAGCETLPSRSGPTPPAGTDKDGHPLQPAAVGTTHAPSSAICNRGFDYTYGFYMVRVAGDSAYVETRVAAVAGSTTQCLALVVAETGWKAVATKRSKIGQCGK